MKQVVCLTKINHWRAKINQPSIRNQKRKRHGNQYVAQNRNKLGAKNVDHEQRVWRGGATFSCIFRNGRGNGGGGHGRLFGHMCHAQVNERPSLRRIYTNARPNGESSKLYAKIFNVAINAMINPPIAAFLNMALKPDLSVLM